MLPRHRTTSPIPIRYPECFGDAVDLGYKIYQEVNAVRLSDNDNGFASLGGSGPSVSPEVRAENDRLRYDGEP